MSIPSRLSSWLPPPRAAVDRGWRGPEPRSRVTRVGRYQIHSLELGEGGQELVLLHGLAGSAHWWRHNVRRLSSHFRVILPELTGFGGSPASMRLPSVGETADILDIWMGKLGFGRVHLGGHSMGGQISLHLAARHPERLDRLVLVDAAGVPRPFNAGAALRFAVEAAPLWRWGDPRFLPTIVRDAWTAGPRTVLGAIAHILRDDVRPILPSVLTPTLIVWGERDNLVPLAHARELRAGIPNSELAILGGAGHNPMVDRPADFDRLLLRFLGGERVGR